MSEPVIQFVTRKCDDGDYEVEVAIIIFKFKHPMERVAMAAAEDAVETMDRCGGRWEKIWGKDK